MRWWAPAHKWVFAVGERERGREQCYVWAEGAQ